MLTKQEVLAAAKPLTREVSSYCTMQYERSLEQNNDLVNKTENREKRLGEWPSFVKETFGRLYNEGETSAIKNPSSFGLKASNTLEGQGSWSELQIASSFHRGIAAQAAADLADAVAQVMGVDNLPENSSSQDPASISQSIDAAQSMGADPSFIESLKQNLIRAEARRKAGLANLEQANRSGKLGFIVSGIAQEASNKAAIVTSLIGCGLGSDGAASPDDQIPIDLVNALSSDPMLADIMRMVGRMQEATGAAKLSKAPSAGGEIVGVTTGGDFSKLVTSELMMLGSDLEDNVVARILERSAMVWETKGEDKRDRGDAVFVLDRSGSMSTYSRHVFARAVGIVGLSSCVAQGRNAAVVAFAGRGVVDVAHVRPGDAKGLKEAIRICTLPPTGDTDIIGALAAAKEASSTLRNPDVMLVTDAMFPQPPRAAVRGACGKDGRLFVIGLGDGASLSMPDADKIWRISGNPTAKDASEALLAISEVR